MASVSGTVATVIVGRDVEIQLISDLLDRLDPAQHALLLCGEPGLGKSALLDWAAAHAASGSATLTWAKTRGGDDGEPFAGLQELLLPLLHQHSPSLPPTLQQALTAAFGLSRTPGPVDPKLVLAGALRLVLEAAAKGPLLFLVDDFEQVDPETQRVLAGVLERLQNEPVSFVISATAAPADDRPGVLTRVLQPLSTRDDVRLLDSLAAVPDGGIRLELLRLGRGIPLVLVELARALRVGQADGLVASAQWDTRRIQQMFARRLARLPEASRWLLVLASAGEDIKGRDLMTAAAGPEAGDQDWEPALAAGLIQVVAGDVVLTHPLLRTAIFDSAPAAQRRRAHARLATVCREDTSAYAWHLAHATVGPSEEVAVALDQAGEVADRLNASFEATKAWERAAQQSPDADAAAVRYLRALRSAMQLGSPSWVHALHAKVLATASDPSVRIPATGTLALVLSRVGRQREAMNLLADQQWRASTSDGVLAWELAVFACAVAHRSGIEEHRSEVARVLGRATHNPEDDFSAALLLPEGLPGAEAYIEAALHPDRVRPSPSPAGDPPASVSVLDASDQVYFGCAAWFGDESDRAAKLLRSGAVGLAQRGLVGASMDVFPVLTGALLDTGRYADAEAAIEEAGAWAALHDVALLAVDTEAHRAQLIALRGDATRARKLAEGCWGRVNLEENRSTEHLLLRALGLAAAAAGDYDTAYRHLRALFDPAGCPRHYFLAPRSVAELATAALHCGSEQDAAAVVRQVRVHAGPRPSVRMRLLLHQAAALVCEDEDVEQHHRLAVIDPQGETWPLERAQARLQYGSWLRRRRRPLEARPVLAAALFTFQRLGSVALAETALRELRAGGGGTSPAENELVGLSPQQQQVVRLAAQGLKNREIAEQLMLSPRTVSSHLYNAYPKLGVAGRHELAGLLTRE